MTAREQHAALVATAHRISARHGAPFYVMRPANDNWIDEEDGA